VSLIDIRRPGTGRRQAEPNQRLAAENQRLRAALSDLAHRHEGAGHFIDALQDKNADLEEDLKQRTAERDAYKSALHQATELNAGLEAQIGTVHALHQEIRELKSRVANLNPCRSLDDATTLNIDARELRQRLAAGHLATGTPVVMTLHEALGKPTSLPTPA